MAWYSGLEKIIHWNAPLARRTTFGIGGPASILLEPSTEEEAARAYAAAAASGASIHLLGGGSNLLVADDGIQGIVFSTAKLRDKTLQAEKSNSVKVSVRAGTPLRRFSLWAAQKGFSGLEPLAGIPGSVGGAVRMNAGGRLGTISACISSVWCIDRSGRVYPRAPEQINWGYRETDIFEPIVRVELHLQEDSADAVKARRRKILAEKRSSQPLNKPSAGCFFKNPPGDSAGRLIESCGLKGKNTGAAQVSTKHANFIVNLGGATAKDVLALAEEVRARVHDRAGILLENEVSIWGLTERQVEAIAGNNNFHSRLVAG